MDIETPLPVLYRFPKVGIIRYKVLHSDERPHNLYIDLNGSFAT